MRISDWSSDVCSSDLLLWPLRPHAVKLDVTPRRDRFPPCSSPLSRRPWHDVRRRAVPRYRHRGATDSGRAANPKSTHAHVPLPRHRLLGAASPHPPPHHPPQPYPQLAFLPQNISLSRHTSATRRP